MTERQIIDYCKNLSRDELIAMWRRILDACADLHPLNAGDYVTVDCDAVHSDPHWGEQYPLPLLNNWVRGNKCRVVETTSEGLYRIDYHQGSTISLPRAFLEYQFTPRKVDGA